MTSRLQLALVVAVAAAIMVFGVLIWMDRMTAPTITVAPVPQQSARVAVSGAVATPGVVDVPPGARLTDVVDAAGGFLPDADVTALNLAGRVGDGEQIVIPSTTRPASTPASEQAFGSADAAGTLIDINTATAEELRQLPGIGEVIAGRVIDYREANGPFASVDELDLVNGISPRLVDELRPLITVTPGG